VVVPVPVGLTVRAIVVLVVVLPDVPVMVTVAAPVVAALVAFSVSTLLPAAGFAPNVAVTPLGRPNAASVTLPVNPLTSVTATVAARKHQRRIPCRPVNASCACLKSARSLA